MSLVNIHIERYRAVIAVDTTAKGLAAGAPEVHSWRAAKMVPFPHAGMVIAGRGDLAITGLLASILLFEPATVDIDIMESRFVEFAKLANKERQALYASHGNPALPDYLQGASELFAVGWSPTRGQMVALTCDITPDGEASLEPVESWCAAPHVWDSVEDVPEMRSGQQMVDVAMEQVRRFRELHPGAPIGGKLLFTEISPKEMSTRVLRDLDIP